MDRDTQPWLNKPLGPKVQPLNFAAWMGRQTWSISEGAKLVCGRNPEERLPGAQVYNRHMRVIDIIDQAFAAAQRGEIKVLRSALLPIHLLVDPAAFLAWAARSGLTLPEPLAELAAAQAVSAPQLSDALRRDRVETIARTLWMLDATLSPGQIVHHPAMTAQVTDHEVNVSDRLEWVAALKAPSGHS